MSNIGHSGGLGSSDGLLCLFKPKTAYVLRISDWSSDVCSSDLAVPGIFGEDLHRDAMLGLRAAEQLLAIEARALGEVREEIGLQCREMIGGHRHVGLAPPDRVTRLVVLDDELVLGAASGVLAGRDDEQIGRAHV